MARNRVAVTRRRDGRARSAGAESGLYKIVPVAHAVLVPSATTEPWATVATEDRPERDDSHLLKVYRPGAMDAPIGRRRPPPWSLRRRLTEQFGNRCAYCSRAFGARVRGPHGKTFALRREWDHRVPFVYLQANPADNWLPACHVCNRLKGARMFGSLVEAKDRLRELWVKHRYADLRPE